jgi:hypothetical protein
MRESWRNYIDCGWKDLGEGIWEGLEPSHVGLA